jgi:hypothetical protein
VTNFFLLKVFVILKLGFFEGFILIPVLELATAQASIIHVPGR